MSRVPIEETIRKRSTPSSCAASMHFTAPPRSTVRLRAAPLPGPGAGGEHDRVRAADVRAHVVGLEVAQHRVRAVGLEVGDVVGVADQAARGVSALGEQSEQATGDLPVPSGDEDVHPAEATVNAAPRSAAPAASHAR